jgi:hypothetical protein
MPYANLSDLRTYFGVDDQIDDANLTIALDATATMVDTYCGRSFTTAGTAESTRVYAAADDYLVHIDDAATVTLVETYDGTAWQAWASDDWQGEPLNGVNLGQAWPTTAIRAIDERTFPVRNAAWVRVTGTWGWPDTPSVVKQAVLLQASRLAKRRDSVLGIAGGPETGLIRVGRAVDGDVAQLLAPYRTGALAVGGLA